jgi:hypothetical protein
VSTTDLLRISLSSAVPLWISDVRDWEPERRVAAARECADVIAAHGDDLQFGGRHAADAFNALARGLACCAYQPGGITFLGDHYEVEEDACKT